MAGRQLYQHGDGALLRAVQHSGLALPAWPDLADASPAGVERWCAWLRVVWRTGDVAEAIEHASPVLARQVELVCTGHSSDARRTRRMVTSLSRYLLRMTGRATPFGLFAGVAPATFADTTSVRWGDGHEPIARAAASWLAGVVARLEGCAELLQRLPVVANDTCFARGARLVVPYQPAGEGESRAFGIDLSIRHTSAVRMAVESAERPIRCADLAARLAMAFPAASPASVADLIACLVNRRVLISSLHAPATATDALGHLLEQLDVARADELPAAAGVLCDLRAIQAGMGRHNGTASPPTRRRMRTALAGRMARLCPSTVQPVAVDLRLDCALALPLQVGREVEAAATALARLAPHPLGAPAWQRFHTRFFERYGAGSLVPVIDVLDPDIGLGFPSGYTGSPTPESPPPASARDERLLTLAQTAALDNLDDIVLDDRSIAELAGGDEDGRERPPHLELCFQVRSRSAIALDRGDFELAVVSVSRGAGTLTGRFVDLLEPADRERMAQTLATLPTSVADAVAVQLSFPPLHPNSAHVARAPRLLPAVVSLAEHRPPSDTTIHPRDLAITSDGYRLHLVSRALGRRLEPVTLHALDLRAHTPPLARFLAEVSRAHASVVTGFDWGLAARLPFLPRVRYRRTILSPARWRLHAAELPGRGAPTDVWAAAAGVWRARRRVPDAVHLAEGDRLLSLDLGRAAHLSLLRATLDRTGHVALTEAPASGAFGWFGGRVHEIVVPLLTTERRVRSPRPVDRMPAIERHHGHLPGTSAWLYAKLYGHRDRQAELLAGHLPELLAEWDEPPRWWFIRYRDPEWHLRLRIALRRPDEFGSGASRISRWTARMRRLGLLRDVQFAPYYPETGRWGDGASMAAAEDVFAADSRAIVAQLAAPPSTDAQVAIAANLVAIATDFNGGVEAAMSWLIANTRTAALGARASLHGVRETVQLADPRQDRAAVRGLPGGSAIAAAWADRGQALTDYRSRLAAAGRDLDEVLVALLHAHHVRAAGVDRDDERTCLRLARAAALAWTARCGT